MGLFKVLFSFGSITVIESPDKFQEMLLTDKKGAYKLIRARSSWVSPRICLWDALLECVCLPHIMWPHNMGVFFWPVARA